MFKGQAHDVAENLNDLIRHFGLEPGKIISGDVSEGVTWCSQTSTFKALIPLGYDLVAEQLIDTFRKTGYQARVAPCTEIGKGTHVQVIATL